jgi:flagellar M-ring protein FliF
VMLKLKTGQRLDSAQARSIANMLAGSVEGLKPENLTIVDVNGNQLSSDSGAGISGLSSQQLATQLGYEGTTQRNLQAMLDRVLGPGKASVQVSALMNWDQTEQTSETYSPGDPTQTPLLTSHAISETTNGGQGTAATGGVPGQASNGGTVPTYQGGAGTGAATTRVDNSNTYQLNKSVQKVVRAPGAVTRLSVSVMLDDDPSNPNAPLRQTVNDAVNAAAGIDQTRGDVLTVTALPFNRDELLATQVALVDVAQKEQLMSYLHLGALVLGPLLMLVALFLILKRGRKKTVSEAATVAAAAAAVEKIAEAIDGSVVIPNGRPGAKPGAAVTGQPISEDPQKIYYREQIQQLGKANPGTVAQLIQTWMDEDRRN